MYGIIGAGILVGLSLPVQTSVNARLRAKLGSPFLASLVSFMVAAAFLALLIFLEQRTLFIPLAAVWHEPLWIWTGGICGVIFLTGNIFLFPRLGSVQTVVLPVLGQVMMGLLIDNFGWFAGQKIELTFFRILGAVLVMCGVTFVSLSFKSNKNTLVLTVPVVPAVSVKREFSLLLWQVFAVAIGMLSAMQTAINGHLGLVVNSPYAAAFISFLVGLIILPAACVLWSFKYPAQKDTSLKMHWWMWTGGIFGALFILVNVFLTQRVGTGMAIIIVLLGAMTGSVLIDHFALLGSRERRPLTLFKLLGLMTMLAGVICVRFL